MHGVTMKFTVDEMISGYVRQTQHYLLEL